MRRPIDLARRLRPLLATLVLATGLTATLATVPATVSVAATPDCSAVTDWSITVNRTYYFVKIGGGWVSSFGGDGSGQFGTVDLSVSGDSFHAYNPYLATYAAGYTATFDGTLAANCTIGQSTPPGHWFSNHGSVGIFLAAPFDQLAAKKHDISGTVTGPDGKPVAGVVIDVRDANGVVVASVITDGHGQYQTIELAPGHYFVEPATNGDRYKPSVVQVDLSSSSATANFTLGFTEIAGTITGTDGNPLPQVTVVVHNSDGTTAATATTNGDGKYKVDVPGGTYVVQPMLPAKFSDDTFGVVSCDGEADVKGTCRVTSLATGARATASFKLVLTLVVNSTSTEVNEDEVNAKVCDVTPKEPKQTCTLPQAIDVADQMEVPVTVKFDIPVDGDGLPVITATKSMPDDKYASLDATSQPGGHVELTGSGEAAAVGLTVKGPNLTVQGMVVNRFGVDLQIGDFDRIGTPRFPEVGRGAANGDIVQDDVLGAYLDGRYDQGSEGGDHIDLEDVEEGSTFEYTFEAGLLVLGGDHVQIGGPGPGEANTIGGNCCDEAVTEGGMRDDAVQVLYSTHTVVQGNTLTGGAGMAVEAGTFNTIGGQAPGEGNTTATLTVEAENDAVVQGNRIDNGIVMKFNSHVTIGGATSVPGSGAGNQIQSEPRETQEPGIRDYVGTGDAIQGNTITGFEVGVDLVGTTQTSIGGGQGNLGNVIDGNGALPGQAGVVFEVGGRDVLEDGSPGSMGPASHDTLADNQITDYVSGYGVLFHAAEPPQADNEPVDDTITGNQISRVRLGISFGGKYLYNHIRAFPVGPNDYQSYPALLSAVDDGNNIVIKGQADETVNHSLESLKVDIYAQGACGDYRITPGLGEQMMTQTSITPNLGNGLFTLTVPRSLLPKGMLALTATATAPDGSTSEFSPCLGIAASSQPNP